MQAVNVSWPPEEVWLFKSLVHNTYGGLSIMFYDFETGGLLKRTKSTFEWKQNSQCESFTLSQSMGPWVEP